LLVEPLPLAPGDAVALEDDWCFVGLLLGLALALALTLALGLVLCEVDGLSTGSATASEVKVPQSEIAGELIETSASGLSPVLTNTTFTVVLSPFE
jgi:hypothetical protein